MDQSYAAAIEASIEDVGEQVERVARAVVALDERVSARLAWLEARTKSKPVRQLVERESPPAPEVDVEAIVDAVVDRLGGEVGGRRRRDEDPALVDERCRRARMSKRCGRARGYVTPSTFRRWHGRWPTRSECRNDEDWRAFKAGDWR